MIMLQLKPVFSQLVKQEVAHLIWAKREVSFKNDQFQLFFISIIHLFELITYVKVHFHSSEHNQYIA